MSKKTRRILISLLSVIALAAGCAAFAYAEDTPVDADGYKLVEHDDKSHKGYVIFDTKQSYVSAMAVCSYRNNEKKQKCYFFGNTEIFLFIDDLFSIYDGTPHGVHFGWKRNSGSIQKGFPNSSDAPGCRQKTTSDTGEKLFPEKTMQIVLRRHSRENIMPDHRFSLKG